MDVDTAINDVKAELKTVKTENKNFKNKEVAERIKQINQWIEELKVMKNEMLDLGDGWRDRREQIISNINHCYWWLASCNYTFNQNCNGLKTDILERLNAEEHYLYEYDRLRHTQI